MAKKKAPEGHTVLVMANGEEVPVKERTGRYYLTESGSRISISNPAIREVKESVKAPDAAESPAIAKEPEDTEAPDGFDTES